MQGGMPGRKGEQDHTFPDHSRSLHRQRLPKGSAAAVRMPERHEIGNIPHHEQDRNAAQRSRARHAAQFKSGRERLRGEQKYQRCL